MVEALTGEDDHPGGLKSPLPDALKHALRKSQITMDASSTSIGRSPAVPLAKEKPWQLIAKADAQEGKDNILYGTMYLVSPDGKQVKTYQVDSGGHISKDQEGQLDIENSALPGLRKDVNGTAPGNAIYALRERDWDVAYVNLPKLKTVGYCAPDKKGFRIELNASDGTDTQGRAGFKLHPDGGLPGTSGCLGIVGDDAIRFRDDFQALGSRAPTELVIAAPGQSIENVLQQQAAASQQRLASIKSLRR